MRTLTKMITVASVVLGSMSIASAQSYDPDMGSGNIAKPLTQSAPIAATHSVLGAYAQGQAHELHKPSPTIRPSTSEESLFDRARGSF
ncbi:hypothetical protein [Rhodoplanes sp. SY1]|uniref:hypothetical protein n=1 Tax=Rhodoplanes sp. SY1 TaxID=3166646 RepID=UPI0038B63231